MCVLFSQTKPLNGVVKTAASRGVVKLSPTILLPRTVVTLLKETVEDADLDSCEHFVSILMGRFLSRSASMLCTS
jgi:hypothetical protein